MAKWVLDAGHGGFDVGIVGKYGKRECDITLDAVYEAKRLLERNGESVLLTRTCDINLSLRERVKIANKWGADYFVSFHMNSYSDDSITGSEIHILQKGSKAEELAKFIKTDMISGLKSIDRGINLDKSVMLRETNMPCVIINAECLSNENIEKSFDSIQYGHIVSKGCLAMVDKVLLDFPPKKPKTPQREGWRICVGYHKEYEDAEKEILKLYSMGIKNSYIIPYPDDNKV